jgi:hypothetical protein
MHDALLALAKHSLARHTRGSNALVRLGARMHGALGPAPAPAPCICFWQDTPRGSDMPTMRVSACWRAGRPLQLVDQSIQPGWLD